MSSIPLPQDSRSIACPRLTPERLRRLPLAEMKARGERAGKGDRRANVVADDISTLPDLGITRDQFRSDGAGPVSLPAMAITQRHDFQVTFADGRTIEIYGCPTEGLARLRASDYHRGDVPIVSLPTPTPRPGPPTPRPRRTRRPRKAPHEKGQPASLRTVGESRRFYPHARLRKSFLGRDGRLKCLCVKVLPTVKASFQN